MSDDWGILHQEEALRRLQMLGETAIGQDDAGLRQQARRLHLPYALLWQWRTAYQAGGLSALEPHDWPEAPPLHLDQAQMLVTMFAAALQEIGVSPDPHRLLESLHVAFPTITWTAHKAAQLVRRYQMAGIMAFLVADTPKQKRAKLHTHDWGSLSNAAVDIAFQRKAALDAWAEQEHVTRRQAEAAAKEAQIHPSTWRRWWSWYRADGLLGLAPRQRRDTGTRRLISSQLAEAITGIRLSQADLPVRAVYDRAVTLAIALQEPPPSLWQVRQICAQIPAPVKLLADGREAAFRNRYRLTHPIAWGHEQMVYQMDHKAPLHLVIRDERPLPQRSPSGEVRPYLTLVMDAATRVVVAAVFGYERPNRFTVAAAIHRALLITPEHPLGGMPQAIWVDNGKDLIAEHIRLLTTGLGIRLVNGDPHHPELRGIVERFHQTLDTRLWATLPGYTGNNTVERNPHVIATLTLREVEQHFWTFIHQYHQEVHATLHQTPMSAWSARGPAPEVDVRLLDVLLCEGHWVKVGKTGVAHQGRTYFSSDLGPLIGERVMVRAVDTDRRPDTVEVFFQHRWITTATALDAPVPLLRAEDIAAAQTLQRQTIHQRIATARAAIPSLPEDPPPTKPKRAKRATPSVPAPLSPVVSSPTTPAVVDFFARLRAKREGQE